MSNSLVRASLDLIDLDNDLEQEKKRKKKNKSKGIIKLIPANHRITKKNKKSDSSVVFSHSRKITVHEAKKQLAEKVDPTGDNVKTLLRLSENPLDLNTAKTLFERGVKRRPLIEDKASTEEERTAFTEEDFKNFEKEYLGE